MAIDKLTQAELKRQFHYNPDTGGFTRLISKKGTKAGPIIKSFTINDKYVQIGINGKKYYAHQLACLYMEGYLPEYDMDHKYGIKGDNRWSQLQHATRSCNMQNQAIHSNNKSGFPGIYWFSQGNKWRSYIKIRGKRIHLGYYEDILEAALARFTFEVQCPLWKCNYRSELVKAIISVWPEFNSMINMEFEVEEK